MSELPLSASLTIRRLVREDFDLWEPIWHAYLRFYRADLPEEITRTTFERLADGTDGLVGLVAQGQKPGHPSWRSLAAAGLSTRLRAIT